MVLYFFFYEYHIHNKEMKKYYMHEYYMYMIKDQQGISYK